jgi:UDP-glucose 4-epimerase
MTSGEVLVTGGAGYIGSHSVLKLLNASYRVVVIDNLVNSSQESLKRVAKITSKDVVFKAIDLLDKPSLKKLFSEHSFKSVIHFAGLKAVGESCQKPLHYFNNNLIGTINLLEIMSELNVKQLIFSSSATVYGDVNVPPFKENVPLKTINPYGRTKLIIEEITRDICASDSAWKIINLRYFNPVGADKSGLIGEDPLGYPNNLMPFIMQVAVGRREYLNIFGNDYNTPDGTCIRDYIHVTDLANGHLAALNAIDTIKGEESINLGAGKGYSVLEVVAASSKAVGKQIPYKIVEKRPGDVAVMYSDPSKAKTLLGWEVKLSLDEMCEDHWRWQLNNPQGYGTI